MKDEEEKHTTLPTKDPVRSSSTFAALRRNSERSQNKGIASAASKHESKKAAHQNESASLVSLNVLGRSKIDGIAFT